MIKKVHRNISVQSSLVIHFIVWVIVLHLLFDISGLYYAFRELFFEGMEYIDEAFIDIPLMIALFYWNSEYLIPKFLSRKSWWKYLIGLILSFLFFIFLANILFELLTQQGYDFRLYKDDFLDLFLVLNLLTIGVSTSLGVTKMALTNVALKKEAVAKQKEAEMKYLIAQVNPHFLFNTLNTIYALSTEENAPLTTEAILKLSEIMRYPINEGSKKKVLLSQEIDFLENYIDLQKIRLGEDYPVSFEVMDMDAQIEIAPLLFISFVENAFKYGVSQHTKKPVSIKISCLDDSIHFQCLNEIVKTNNIKSHELGIINIKSRLDLIYGENYVLSSKVQDQRYFVDLNIKNLSNF